jgi:predicted AAA+ superfamily ATPase
VDRDRKPGRFLLTGSANLLLMQRVSESLAGRAVYLTLWPMTELEKQGRPEPGPWSEWLAAKSAESVKEATGAVSTGEGWQSRALAGGYPVPALSRDPDERAQWFDGYVCTYLERDLQDLASISSVADFRRLMRLGALRVGQMLNQSHLARDCALPQATAHRYLNLLEASCQIVRLPAFATSRRTSPGFPSTMIPKSPARPAPCSRTWCSRRSRPGARPSCPAPRSTTGARTRGPRSTS